MRLANPNLSTQGKEELRVFAVALLRVGNRTDTVFDPFLKADIYYWEYGWIEKNERGDLINAIYRNLYNIAPIRQAKYLAKRTILAFINTDIIKINDEILERNTEALKVFKAVD